MTPGPPANPTSARSRAALSAEAEAIRQGGGAEAVARQHAKGRMTARERIAALTDPGRPVPGTGPLGRLPPVRRVGRRARRRVSSRESGRSPAGR